MKNTVLFLLFLLLCVGYPSHSQQTVSFDYDAAGNRVLRQIAVKELKAGDSLFQSPALQEPLTDNLNSGGETVFNVYPNPSPDGITIENTGEAIEGKLSYLLYDNQGKIYLEGSSNTHKTALNLYQLQPGTYLLHLRYNGKMQVFKVIKQ